MDLPAGVTADPEFSRYVAIDSDLPVAADSTDDEICAQVQGQRTTVRGRRMTRRSTPPAARGAAGVNDCSETPTFSDAVCSLHTLRAYLEASGCQDFYKVTDQVYHINRKNSVQKTMKDYFSGL